jgi:hypothetical protein
VPRNLPVRPNLEYLRNEAKELLEQLRRTNASAQLADAQFALARDYGHDSWPKLKAHVEQLATRTQHVIAGGWVANVAHSRRHPANPFRGARMHFTVNGNSIDIVDEFVDESGKTTRGRNHVEADGLERDSGNGYRIAVSWIANGFQAVTTKDKKVVGRTTYAVSPDRRILTIADNGGESVIVLDRLIQ